MLLVMKKIFRLTIMMFILCSVVLPMFQVQSWNFDQTSPVKILDEVHYQSNKNPSDDVQDTKLDVVTSKYSACDWIAPDSRFTLTRTLCSIKANVKNYLQYVMYLGLTAATILLIRNWFKIVTAPDQGKQIWEFKKNFIYIVIWVLLLIGFYYIIDIFISVVNLVAE